MSNEKINVKKSIQVIKGDITKLEVDCIVNAANKKMVGGGGVDGAIHRAAGPKLLDACRKLKGCNTGEAKFTEGFNLSAKYIIHTVGPKYTGKASDEEMLRNCYMNSLDLAMEIHANTIAFPAIATGAYGYPLEDATKIAFDTVNKWLDKHNDYDMEVIFCCFDKATFCAYDKYVNVIASKL